MISENVQQPVVVGEAIVGRFPDGSEVVGGSALNVARAAQSFGARPLLVTRVGADDEGQRVVATLHELGLDTRGVQRDPELPTGQVVVRSARSVVEGEGPAAHLRIDPAQAAEVAADGAVGMIYHSTYLARDPTAWQRLHALRVNLAVPVLLDLDGVGGWIGDRVQSALLGSRWIKVPERDLDRLCRAVRQSPGESVRDSARLVLEACAVELVLVTRECGGAVAVSRDRIATVPPPVEQQAGTRPGVRRAGRGGDAGQSGDGEDGSFVGLHGGQGRRPTLRRAVEHRSERRAAEWLEADSRQPLTAPANRLRLGRLG